MNRVTYVGPAIDDQELYRRLPREMRAVLVRDNGFIAFSGGLHVRGASRAPGWHSLREAWEGEHAIHRLWPTVTPEDVPFAQDALGDQFVLRDGIVRHVFGETGKIASVDCGLADFLAAARARPVEYLGLHPLVQFREDGGALKPGELLSIEPPFSARDTAHAVTVRPMPALERLRALSAMAAVYAREEEARRRESAGGAEPR